MEGFSVITALWFLEFRKPTINYGINNEEEEESESLESETKIGRRWEDGWIGGGRFQFARNLDSFVLVFEKVIDSGLFFTLDRNENIFLGVYYDESM